jgi:hypothetical protein
MLETILKVGGLLLTAMLVVERFRTSAWSRSRLQADLQVFRLLDADDPLRKKVKTGIEQQVERLYGSPSSQSHWLKYNWSEILLSGIVSGFFVWWTIHLAIGGFSGWILLTFLGAAFGAESLIREILFPTGFKASAKKVD